MAIRYKLPDDIVLILSSWSFIGFDDIYGCAEAILTNDDWATRWDLSDATLDDLNAVHAWKEAVLLNNQVNAPINNLIKHTFGV